MAKISDTTSYPNIAPVGDDYLILTDKDSALATKTVTVENLGVYLFGNIPGSLIPALDDTYDIGSASKEWRDLYIDGVARIDDLRADVGEIITLTVPTSFVLSGAVSGSSLITATTLSGASNTNIASTLAIKTYVDTAIGTVDDLSCFYDTSTTSVNIPTQSLRILGTANQITTTGDGAQTMQIAFPTNITTPGQLNSTGIIIPVTDKDTNLGATGNRWQNFFTENIADASNNLGTATQFLGKNSANTGLEWKALTNEDLNVRLTSSGTPTFTVDLASQSLGLLGTTNEIETVNATNQTAAFRLAQNITTRGQLNSTGIIIPVTDKDTNLGGTSNRWQNFFTENIADAANNLGTAGQVLAKNAGNTGLEWITNGASDTLNVSITSVGTTATSIDLPTQKLSLLGTANAIEVTNPVGQTIAFNLPLNITTRGQLNSLGPIIPTTDATQNLGSTVNRWQNFFAQNIADLNDNLGTAGQILVKNAGNSGLQWVDEANDKTLTISDGSTTGNVDLPTQSLTFTGTANQIEATVLNQAVTFAFPTNITTAGQLNSGGPIIPTANATHNLGSTVNRWLNFFTTQIVDKDDLTGGAAQILTNDSAGTAMTWTTGGTATQVLAKNSTNNGLVWVDNNEYSSWKISDGESPPNQTAVNDLGTVVMAGTANQIRTLESAGTVTFSFPTNITTPGQLNSGGPMLPTSDVTFNLGGTSNRWLNLFTNQIVDAGNNTGGAAQILTNNTTANAMTWTTGGTEGQLLARKTGNVELEWVDMDDSSLEFLGDTNTAVPTVDLNSQSFSILGTANEIETVGVNQSLTIALPTNITTKGQLNSTGIIIPVTDKDINLGGTSNRWQNFFTENIVDEGNNLGTANQILAKNAGNTGLEWKDSNYDILEVTTTITNAQMLAISSTPIQVAPSPGANKLIAVVECLWKLDYAAPVFDFAADPFIRYDSGGANTQYRPFGAFDNGIVNGGADFYQAVPPVQSQGNANGQILVNNGLFFTAAANPSQGGGTLTFKVKYRVEDAF